MKKLLNKANPSTEGFKEFRNQMCEVKKLFKSQVEGKKDIEEISTFIKELIENQDSDGYWKLIDSDDIPFDAIIEYWKYPTVLFTAMMIHFLINHPKECTKLKGFDEVLFAALDILEHGKLVGHGFSSFSFMVNSLKTLLQGDVMKYIQLYPAKHKAFTELIKFYKLDFEKILNEGKTRFDYNEEFTLRLEEVFDIMNEKNKVYLFVYGTLMRGNRQGKTYLDSEDFKGVGTLSGYALYDLEYFPGIVKDIDGRVKGELYSISEDKLSTIDTYEAEGILYKRIMVKVYSEKDEPVEAYVYVYNKPVLGKKKIEFSYQPWFSGISDTNLTRDYVWYASYGSNTNKGRFMKYIMGDESRDGIHKIGCTDKTPPKDEKQIIIQHPIYFSNNSPRWNNKGVAFLDLNKKGTSYGKMYLITKEQFNEIHKQEGLPWYNEIVDLGYEGGIPIKTFTHNTRLSNDVAPCVTYLDIIKKGIKETYPNLNDVDIDLYLLEKYLVKDKLAVLAYIRKKEHGVSIQKISNDLNKDKESVIRIIKDLKDAELIKQDGRSVRDGMQWNATFAIYYTVSNRRALIDQVLMDI